MSGNVELKKTNSNGSRFDLSIPVKTSFIKVAEL
jgi:hypothetical protein